MFLRRLATALALAPVVLGAIWLGGWAIVAGILAVITLASYELAEALEPLPIPAALGAGALPVLLSTLYGANGILAGALLGLPWALLWIAGWPDARTLRAVLALLLMALWVGASLAHLVLIEALPTGFYLILVAVVGTWVSDAGAYFSGHLFGRRKLFPILSPNKTYEGAVGSFLLTTLAVGFFVDGVLGFGALAAALWGVTIAALSQAGDLFESVLKRLLELKDLGRALPGHGGILDRMDSLLFTAPAVYYLYVLSVQ